MWGCIAIVAVVLVALFLSLIGLHYWYIVVPFIAIGFMIYKGAELGERRRAEDAAQEAEEARKRCNEEERKRRLGEDQRRYRDELRRIAKQSIDVFEKMPGLLMSA